MVVIAANVLLGLNQGLTWSTTIVMKIDLVGPARRGLAMGFNEAAGYLALAATGWLAVFATSGLGMARIGVQVAVYPLVWSLGQLVTGGLPDRWGRKRLIAAGMLWRDLGYAVGALLAGITADLLGLRAAIALIAAITAASGLLVAVRMYETHQRP